MNLAVFDLDGTLTRTTGVDDHCYVRAMHRALGLRGFDDNWANYPHATDEGLMRGIALLPPPRGGLGRDVTLDEAAAVRREFLELLRQSAASDARRFIAMPGVPRIIEALAQTGEWVSAIATGAWRESALIKVRTAGIQHLLEGASPIAAAFAGTPAEGGGVSRESIVNLAIQRAGAATGVARFDRIVCVGDGVWDLRTARNLSHGFVGVAHDDRRRTLLLSEGATTVLEDFADTAASIRAIAEAKSP